MIIFDTISTTFNVSLILILNLLRTCSTSVSSMSVIRTDICLLLCCQLAEFWLVCGFASNLSLINVMKRKQGPLKCLKKQLRWNWQWKYFMTFECTVFFNYQLTYEVIHFSPHPTLIAFCYPWKQIAKPLNHNPYEGKCLIKQISLLRKWEVQGNTQYISSGVWKTTKQSY